MKTITIELPDDCEIQIVKKKEEKKEQPTLIIRTYQDLYDKNSDAPPLDNYYSVKALCESAKVTEKVAKSMLAMAMISQLMPYYGGAITDEEWGNGDIAKYVILRKYNKIFKDNFKGCYYYFLAFHTAEQRDNFLKYNEQLIKDYLMIDFTC